MKHCRPRDGVGEMMLAVSIVVWSLAAPPAASEAERPKILVYNLRNDGVDPNRASLIRDSITTELSNDGRVDVVSVEEMRRVMQVQGDQAEAGCDVNSASCQAEIAQALGARYLLSGNVGVLGDLTIINISVTDMTNAATLSRKQIEVRAVNEIPAAIRASVPDLVAPFAPREAP